MIFRMLGNIRDLEVPADIETVTLEWFELEKRVLRKTTDRGREIGIVVEGSLRLKQGDVLQDSSEMIAVEIARTLTIVFEPADMRQMAQICYELGNRHAVVFLEGVQVLVPFDPTITELFDKLNLPHKTEKRRLESVLRAESHHHH